MRAGLVSITFRQLSPEAVIEAAVEAKLEGIEWGGDVHVPHGDTEKAAWVATKTRDAGLAVTSYGSYYRFEECDVDSNNGGPSMRDVLDTAAAMGAPSIRLWAGQRSPDTTSPIVWEAIVNRARQFCEEAMKLGMRIDFEYHDHTLTETPESTCRFLEEIGHPAARSLWQPPLQTPVKDRLAGLIKVMPWISNLHCNHFDQDAWPHIHPLEAGAAEWGIYLGEFDVPTDDRWILLEHVKAHAVEQFMEDAKVLRSWIG